MLENLLSLNKKISKIQEVISIILYGSAARGEMGKKSDIDLLIITTKKSKKIEEWIEKVIERENIGKRIVPIIETKQGLLKNPYYMFDILRDGIILYKNPSHALELPFAIKEKGDVIFSYKTVDIPQNLKTKLNRVLFGIAFEKKLKRGKIKKYTYHGFLKRVKGEQIGKGVIMVSAKAEKDMENIFKKYGVEYKKFHIITVERYAKQS